jgi:magnesium transporter
MIVIRVLEGGRNFVASERLADSCWVDARNVDKSDIERLEKEYHIDAELLTDIMDVNEQSRIEHEEDYVAIILRLPVFDPTYETAYFTVPIGIIIFADKIVTVCQRSSEALDDISMNRVRGLSFWNTTAFVLNILGRAAFAFLKDLKELNINSNLIEQKLQKSVRNNELIQLLSLQKSLVFFTTSIKSNELLIEKMKKSPMIRGKEEEKDLLDDVMTENIQALEMADIYSSILTGTMDAFASVISNNLNIVMKRLAIVNIVLMIPTLIYSFYGMNVTLPFTSHALTGVGILAASLAASALGVVLLNIDGRFPRRRR